MSYADKYKWAWCICTRCQQRHKDIIGNGVKTLDKHGKPKIIRQICDRCFCAGKAFSTREAYYKLKREIGACLEPLT